MFSYVVPEQRVPADHPLRKIRTLVDEVLGEMSPDFSRLYADTGRPSIAPFFRTSFRACSSRVKILARKNI